MEVHVNKSYPAALLGVTLASLPVVAQAAPDVPAWVSVASAQATGSGCSPATTGVYITSSRQGLGLTWGELRAEAGPGLPPSAANAFCGFTIDLSHPDGWSYALVTAVYGGRASLSAGVIAQHTLTHWFLGEPGQAKTAATLTGPYQNSYARRDGIPGGDLVWSPCDESRPLRVDVDLSVSFSTGGAGLLVSRGNDARVLYGLRWRRC
jgi:Domain of unknown function (DUF4360)